MTTMNAPAGGPAGTLAAGLELCRAQLLDTQAPSPIQALMVTLDRVRAASSGGEWHRLVENAREHPLFKLLMQDPYTARAFQKPRGYAGDAVMLDYVYGRRAAYHDAGVTDLGMAIHAYSAGASPPARAVRWRRDWIASQIETSLIAAGRPVKVLSFACGHLREYEQVHPMLRDRACNWTAADQDLESLAHVRDCYDSRTVKCSATSVRALLRGSHDLDSDCDLVYFPWLVRLFERPGGRSRHGRVMEACDPRRAAHRGQLRYRYAGRRVHGDVHGLVAHLPLRGRLGGLCVGHPGR